MSVLTIVATVAAVVTTVGAVFTVVNFRRVVAKGQRAEARYTAKVQPRARFSSARLNAPPGGEARLLVRLVNPGGSAIEWVAVIHAGTFVFVRHGPCVPRNEMAPGPEEVLKANGSGLPPYTAGDVGILGSYALDIEGRAWDLMSGQRTEQSEADYFRPRLAPLGIGVDDERRLYPLPAAV
jgi:hypothetical protein